MHGFVARTVPLIVFFYGCNAASLMIHVLLMHAGMMYRSVATEVHFLCIFLILHGELNTSKFF